jgi:hypothetical protein
MRSPHNADASTLISRRLLLTGAASAVVLAACGSRDSDSARPTTSTPTEPNSSADGLALVRFFAEPSVTTGTNRRLVFGLADTDGTLRTEGPTQVAATLIDATGAQIATLTGRRRDVRLPRAYYEFRVDVPNEGAHTLRVDDAGAIAEASFTVAPAGSLTFAGPGDPLPPFDSPTMAAPGGVDPVCTREPACPFHDTTLTDALAAGAPVVYLVGTPAFCQTGICGPVLDVMIDIAADYPDLQFIHAEVYTDSTATTAAPAVDAAGLSFEPVIFLTNASGTVVERLDVIVDESELREHLDALS